MYIFKRHVKKKKRNFLSLCPLYREVNWGCNRPYSRDGTLAMLRRQKKSTGEAEGNYVTSRIIYHTFSLVYLCRPFFSVTWFPCCPIVTCLMTLYFDRRWMVIMRKERKGNERWSSWDVWSCACVVPRLAWRRTCKRLHICIHLFLQS